MFLYSTVSTLNPVQRNYFISSAYFEVNKNNFVKALFAELYLKILYNIQIKEKNM